MSSGEKCLSQLNWVGKSSGAVLGLLAFLSAPSAHAWQWDLSTSLQARGRPVGLSAGAQVGGNQLLWGEKEPGSHDGQFLYGYLRPSLRGHTSGVVNGYDARLELFPISFVSLSVGQHRTLRLAEFHAIDCVSLECGGSLARNYARAGVLLAQGPIFAGGSIRREHQIPTRTGHGFYDEISALSGSDGGDYRTVRDAMAGYRWGEARSLGVLYLTEAFQNSESQSTTQALFYAGKLAGSMRGMVGLGRYESNLLGVGGTVLFQSQWVFSPSLEL